VRAAAAVVIAEARRRLQPAIAARWGCRQAAGGRTRRPVSLHFNNAATTTAADQSPTQ